MKKRNNLLIFGLLIFMVLISIKVSARDFKVYGYDTPAEGELELAYSIDHFIDSDKKYTFLDGKVVNKEGLFRHTLEVEYGVTDRWTIAGYLDFEDPKGESLKYVQARAVLGRYRLFEKGERFFDSTIYVEYYLPDQRYRDSEKIETKLILEKDLGNKLSLLLNPKFEKKISGAVEEGTEFEYSAGLYYRHSSKLIPGLEFHGELGELKNFKSLSEQEHWIFPTVDLGIVKNLKINLGLGFGLTENSDRLVFKGLFEYEFYF